MEFPARAVFAVAAIAMTAVTIVALIVVPATIDINVSQFDSLAQPSRSTPSRALSQTPSQQAARSMLLDIHVR